MAKESYKIRASLDRSRIDRNISIPISEDMGVKSLYLGSLLFGIGGVLSLMAIMSYTFMKNASLPVKSFFSVFYLLMVGFCAYYTKFKELSIVQVKDFLEYIPRRSRIVKTGFGGDIKNFASITGITNFDKKTGIVQFYDGGYGVVYSVVGSASRLLFEKDQNLILDAVNNFYTKLPFNVEMITFTTKEAQKVYAQAYYLEERYKKLKAFGGDDELLELLEEEYDILKNHVGKEYTSIHQYVMLRADNAPQLKTQLPLFERAMLSSQLVFKSVERLDSKDVQKLLGGVYKEYRAL